MMFKCEICKPFKEEIRPLDTLLPIEEENLSNSLYEVNTNLILDIPKYNK